MKPKLLALPFALGLAASSAFGGNLVIKGSDTLGAKLVPQLAEAYKAQNPDTSFEIAAEGSTTGIAAVIDGTAAIGMSSRLAKNAGCRPVTLGPIILRTETAAIYCLSVLSHELFSAV